MSKNNDSRKAIEAEFVSVELDRLEPNEGQLDGLPANPREILETKLDLLKKDIQAYPELTKYRMLMVYPLPSGKYIVIGGNMRLRAMRELGFKTAPCVIIPKETPIEKLKAYTILDNSGFGKWEWSMLANEWEADALAAWGLDLPMDESEIDVDSFFDKLDKEAEKDKGEKITVSIPDEYADQKEEIKSRIEATLMGKFEGIKIK
ncbi:MAG: ParB N-terminal domain-containing protein [Alistipes senegalensis]|nr:ParB N-terminal domain-containing protein [Bacteroides cellulosilyticus]MCM1351238.1 ParB N-terminal domain-containing protein [Alistipes senegalensis]